MNKTYRTKAGFPALIFCALVLTGCSFGPSLPTPEEQAEKVEQFMTEGGYSASRDYQIDSVRETWRHDGQAIEVSMLAPKAPGDYPLIIYLPGLGESADGGRLWRETWAKAGYAVFSVQPAEISSALKELTPMQGKPGDDKPSDDEDDSDKSRPSKAVRNSELHYVGHEYFSPASLKKRINHLLWAYAQLKLRVKAGQGLFKSVDVSRVIIAGYDIGAQTTEEMIGEKFGADFPQAQDFSPIAAMLFSPSVDMALGNLTNRYKNIAIPLLVVTGSEDDDPYGISSPYVRTAIWEYAPPGNKYLLVLNKGGHQLLAGSNLARRQEAGPAQEFEEKAGPSEAMQRFGTGNALRGGGRRGGGGSSAGSFGGMGRPSHGGRQNGGQDAKHIAAVFSVSTAFLDIVCKSDKFAQSWITGKANQWLNKSASLKIK
ncbi:MAG TPA: hypothetical protein VIF37_09345 [Methylobacter sp.]|jgi:hypothetical protein